VEHGDIRNLTNTAAFAERDPAWSPNGNGLRIFRMSPANMRCHLRGQDGMGEVRKISLGNPPTFFIRPPGRPTARKSPLATNG